MNIARPGPGCKLKSDILLFFFAADNAASSDIIGQAWENYNPRAAYRSRPGPIYEASQRSVKENCMLYILNHL